MNTYFSYFDSNFENWRTDGIVFEKLVSSLITDNKIDALKFLINNLDKTEYSYKELDKHISYYGSLNNNMEIVNDKPIDNISYIFTGALNGGHVDIAKYALYRSINKDSKNPMNFKEFIKSNIKLNINEVGRFLNNVAESSILCGSLNAIKCLDEITNKNLAYEFLIELCKMYNRRDIQDYLIKNMEVNV